MTELSGPPWLSPDDTADGEQLQRALGVPGRHEVPQLPIEGRGMCFRHSVLIYVPAKQQALQEFYRVLKPGGWLSIFEPINRFAALTSPFKGRLFDVTPIQAIADKVHALYERLQPRETDPMMNFDERDLLRWTEQAGFE
jgi:SAM-dependent methyltransferase